MIDIENNKNFCPAPWVSLYAEPSGRVDNCCISKNKIGTVNASIDAVLTGKTNIKIQTDMLNDIDVPGCNSCKIGPENYKQSFLTRFPDHDNPLYTPGQFQLKYLDVRWSNTCNLACVYCGPTLSSLWAQEIDEVFKIEQDSKTNLLDYVINNVETLQQVYLAGGEPLLMKENEILIEEIVARNPRCGILVNTNLLNVNTEIYRRLIGLSNVMWMPSFEAVENQYEYMRYPGKWSKFKTNLLALLNDVGPSKISFNMVYCNLNYLTFWDTVDWAESQGFFKQKMNISLYNNGVHDGPYDLRLLSKQSREQAKQRILSKDYSMLNGYNKVLDYLERDATISTYFVEHSEALDRRRNLDSRNIFPDVYQSIESTYESN